MPICKTGDLGTWSNYKFVVVLSRYRGQILLSRHCARTTWETQGGHIEKGETPLEAARRELFEESGALEYELEPLFDYWSGELDGGEGASGVAFFANITRLGPLPESEMAQVEEFAALPKNLTYPDITPHLFARAAEYFAKDGGVQ